MMGGLSPRKMLVMMPLLVAALAGAVVTLRSRDADLAFLHRQQHPPRVRQGDVERVLRSAPEPVAKRRTPARGARCRTSARRGLRNPWRCIVTYRSGRIARYRVVIGADGTYRARHIGGSGIVEGCCVSMPGQDSPPPRA